MRQLLISPFAGLCLIFLGDALKFQVEMADFSMSEETDFMSTQPRILVVDDDDDVREVMKMDLEDHGFTVFEASSGNEALEFCKANSVDLIVSDIRMPDGNGVELLRTLRARGSNDPVLLFVSGQADITTEDAFDIGAGGLLTKPWSVPELIRRVERLIQDPRIRWKRKTERLDANFTIDFNCDGFNAAIKASLGNIGRGGMFVVTDERMLPAKESKINFNFVAAGGIKIGGAGEVRWVRNEAAVSCPRGFGVEFSEIDAGPLEELLKLIQNLNSPAFIPKTLAN